MMNVQVCLIDPQFDFTCPQGNLFVGGSPGDMTRLATMINRLSTKISDIHVTLDSHVPLHISLPYWWVDKKGNNPPPFTQINVEDIENGTFRATKPSLQAHSLKYVKTLKSNGRYTLTVWPIHCLIGSIGQTIHPEIEDALNKWGRKNFAYPNFVTKGSNILTEHYSAVQADVPDPSDPSTQLNVGLINTLQEADIILFAGEASSHCCSFSLIDVVNNFADIKTAQKIKVLKDGMSPVGGFEAKQDELFAFCAKHGIEVLNSTEVLL